MIPTLLHYFKIEQAHKILPCLEHSLFLVIAIVIAIAITSLFLLLGLSLKGLTIVGVVRGILSMQYTVEFLFSVVFVAGIVTTFIFPAGFVFMRRSLIGSFS